MTTLTITELCLEIFKATGASELTGQNIDIAHRVQSGSDFGPKPIISVNLFKDRAKENRKCYEPATRSGKCFSLYSGLQFRNFFGASQDL